MSFSSKYDTNVLSIKQYGDHIVKVSMLSSCRVLGFEDDRNFSDKCTVNKCKLSNNLSRAKSKVIELALCNPWQFWCTFTLSPQKYDRYNLNIYKKDFMQFINNLNRKRDVKILYLLIPEMHEDTAWHMHGFINGLLDDDLVRNDNGYLTWKKYNDKFGYMSLSHIKNIEKTASYSLKYMTKDNTKNVMDLGAHLYYASHGLNTAKQLYKGHGTYNGVWDWTHPEGYLSVKTLDLREVDLSECIEVF